jgi:20S proteasome alpha/beta subunit
MSLIISVYVPTGIVISGDSRTTGTISQQVQQPTPNDPNATITVQTKVVISDSAEKVFIVFDRYGFGTFGDALINNMPIAHYIEQFENQYTQQNIPQTTHDISNQILNYFRSINPIPKIGLIVAGYDSNTPYVFGVDTNNNTTSRVNVKQNAPNNLDYGIARGGDSAIINRLLSQAQHNPIFVAMNLQDAVDYSRHLIRSTIDQMRFEPRFPSVGGTIDTLIVTKSKTNFLLKKEISC